MSCGQPWSGISLGFVGATGDLTQLYPPWFPAGVTYASATNGQQIRKPTGGTLDFLQISTNGTDGGTIEIWDINGQTGGADVSGATAITNTQLLALVSLGKAKLIYSEGFTATVGAVTPAAASRVFSFGLAARFVAAAGACSLNLVVNAGAYLTDKVG